MCHVSRTFFLVFSTASINGNDAYLNSLYFVWLPYFSFLSSLFEKMRIFSGCVRFLGFVVSRGYYVHDFAFMVNIIVSKFHVDH